MKKSYMLWLLVLIPFFLFGETQPEGLGTIESPFLIQNYDNLIYISNHYLSYLDGYYFKQTADINAQATHSVNSGQGFKPIGNSSNIFQGYYDGQGHSIDNLYINRDEENIALFGRTENSVISNLSINNLEIIGSRFVAGLIGYGTDSSIYNCSTEGEIRGTLEGFCNVAGIIGVSKGVSEIVNCFSITNITGHYRIGGIVDYIESTSRVENCYYIGNLTALSFVGGVVSYIHDRNNCIIKNCYSAASISCQEDNYCGLLIGRNAATNISACIVQLDNTFGVVGSNSGITNLNSANYQALTQEQMKDESTYINYDWDFSTTWFLDDAEMNNGYPYLYWQENDSYSMFIIDAENNQSIAAPDLNIEISFNSELPEGTQILVNSYSTEDSPMTGIANSQQILGDNFWRIKTTYNESITYELSLDLSKYDLPSVLSGVKILKRENENYAWVDVTELGANLAWQEGEVTISGLDSFSDFIPVLDSSTLPVELSAFSANLSNDNSVNIQWLVESESNLSGYYILHNNINDISSAEIIPALINATNSSQQHCYSFIDHPTSNDLNIFYWLKSIELCGNEEIYGPVQVILNNDTNSSPVIAPLNKLYSPFPNPFNPTTTISYSIDRPQFVELEIYNMKGQLVRNLFSDYVANSNIKHSLVWDGKDNNKKNVSSEMYLIKLKLENENIIQKALLIK